MQNQLQYWQTDNKHPHNKGINIIYIYLPDNKDSDVSEDLGVSHFVRISGLGFKTVSLS